MVCFTRVPVGTAYGHYPRTPLSGRAFYNPFRGSFCNPFRGSFCSPSHRRDTGFFFMSPYRSLPRPIFPEFYNPYDYRATSFNTLDERAFTLGLLLTTLALGILLCVIL